MSVKFSKVLILFDKLFFFSSEISFISHTLQSWCLPFSLVFILDMQLAQQRVLWSLHKYSSSCLCFLSWQNPVNNSSVSLSIWKVWWSLWIWNVWWFSNILSTSFNNWSSRLFNSLRILVNISWISFLTFSLFTSISSIIFLRSFTKAW